MLYFQNIKSIYQLQFKHVPDLLVNPTTITGTEKPAIGSEAGLVVIVRRERKQTTFKAISGLKQSDLFTEL